ncbi:MAG: RNA-directed DNA polymerase [Prevotella sp.]|nr:RNA-directed DNA polymerase [Prevotella sp.]MBQ9186656.1 RNA-directed DNA polymerase [Prevotella sp.]
MSYRLTYEQLLADLHHAYLDARRHKRRKPYQLHFEAHAEENLQRLCDELWQRRYQPLPSTCFIISDPKQREVFAAQFRDRIVHHLYYNYVHEMLERTFISDSYSCIRHRGTHYGIARLEHHIRQESLNYTRPCYVLKMDVRGYFMHIDRRRLLDITLRQLHCMTGHRCGDTRWRDRVDMEFVEFLTRVIILQDPTLSCHRRGSLLSWQGMPASKSLFHSPEGCGLPIGNLTSQLFSNVYLNELDQWMKRHLGCRHYGRYVDDFYVVSADREWLLSLRQPIGEFLRERLSLEVSSGKTVIRDVCQGVEFLGAYLKPRRRYVSNATLRRMERKVPLLSGQHNPWLLCSSLNSFLGLLCHYRCYRLRCQLFLPMSGAWRYGYFLRGVCKYVLFPDAS